MEVLVIQEFDMLDNEQIVIGVADSVEIVEKILKTYYGEHKVIAEYDEIDFGVEIARLISVEGAFKEYYQVTIRAQWFQLNKV